MKKAGIIYHDLKPENILLAADGHVKVVDFGLALDAEARQWDECRMGTSMYMAPELAKHRVQVLYFLQLVSYCGCSRLRLFLRWLLIRAVSSPKLCRLCASFSIMRVGGMPLRPQSMKKREKRKRACACLGRDLGCRRCQGRPHF